MTTVGVVAGLLSALVFGVASVVQARSVRGFGADADSLTGFLTAAVRDGGVWVVVAAYLAGFALHAVAIWLLPLYLAQAMIAMQLPVTALLGGRIEARLGRRLWLAVGVVTAGLVLLTLAAGTAGEVVRSAGVAVAFVAGAAALAGVALLARRLSGAGIGALAGLGYAGSALAVRGVGTPVDATVVVMALTVPAYSVIAFWLYSVAMRRARVATASASLIVVQTLAPAAVGLALLGDGVRAGWWPALVAGLLLATGGAVAMSVDAAA